MDYYITNEGVYKVPGSSSAARYFIPNEAGEYIPIAQSDLQDGKIKISSNNYVKTKGEFYTDSDSYAGLLKASFDLKADPRYKNKSLYLTQALDKTGLHSGKGPFKDISGLYDIRYGATDDDDLPLNYGDARFDLDLSKAIAQKLRGAGFGYLIGAPEFDNKEKIFDLLDPEHRNHIHTQSFKGNFLNNFIETEQERQRQKGIHREDLHNHENTEVQNLQSRLTHTENRLADAERHQADSDAMYQDLHEKYLASTQKQEDQELEKAIAEATKQEIAPEEDPKNQMEEAVKQSTGIKETKGIDPKDYKKDIGTIRKEYMTMIDKLKGDYDSLQEAFVAKQQEQEQPKEVPFTEKYKKLKDIYQYLRA